MKIPFMGIIGDKEIENGTVAVRTRDGKDLGSMAVEDIIALFQSDTEKFSRELETNTE